ncbi:hypothetical protein [Kitasatospora phosalacinea]|uniref:Uncharacterized protein n=1 Tax=Kitasatospora phosalacinea TaxID=2065 RepID=A0ABW6GD42_9ACTN
MALREHSRPVTAGRSGRHGRPRPFVGWLRLPTVRFSGAAMAMSTVVGISLATTWLLNEQQQVGRRADVTVGGPPAPSPDAAPSDTPAPAPGSTVQAAPATAGGSATGGSPSAGQGTSSSPSSGGAAAGGAAAGGAPAGTSGGGAADDRVRPAQATTPAPPVRPAEAATTTPPVRPAEAATASPGASPSPSRTPLARPVSLAPSPSAPAPSASPSPSPSASPSPGASVLLPRTLLGTARTDLIGPTGTRHTLRLDLSEAMTALQVELRLNRPTALPGTAPATDLPGAVVTIAVERDTLVYRFTAPADLPPGSYTFTVTGALPAPTAAPAPAETWTASAFALPTTRALAARGTF